MDASTPVSTPKALPRLEAYLNGLPGGLDAHPQCQSRAGSIRAYIDDRPLTAEEAKLLPAPLAELALSPPSFRSSVSNVHFHAYILGAADIFGLSDDEFIDWVYRSNHKMFSTLTFKILMTFLNPESLLDAASHRWSAIMGETTLELIEKGKKAAKVRVTYPPHLFGGLMAKAYTSVFRAALEKAGGTKVTVVLDREAPTESFYSARWS